MVSYASGSYLCICTVFIISIGFHFTSAISIPIKRSEQDLSTCDPEAICGTVQMTSRGFTASPLCSCSGSEECPLVWDMTDRRSVTQGSTQYKHCKAVPPRRSNRCMADQTAYAMKIITPFSEEEDDDGSMMKISHRIYCTCPENYQQIQQGEDLERIPFVGEIKTYSMTCAPFPICRADESCKTLSETKTQFLENETCRCAQGTHCPVAGNRKAKSIDFGMGRITQLFCQ